MKDYIEKLISKFIKQQNIEGDVFFGVEYPKSEKFGHYSTNVAMILSNNFKKLSIDFASKLRDFCYAESKIFEKIDIVKPGFVNFFIKSEFIYNQLKRISNEGWNYFKPTVEKKNVQVEFVSANPTGPLHIGHGRGAAIGDCIGRILTFANHTVWKEYYVNDAGKQMQLLGITTFIRYKELLGVGEALPENAYRGDYIVDIANNIMNEYGTKLLSMGRDEAIDICTKKASSVIMPDILNTLKEFRVSFDQFFYESTLYNSSVLDYTIDDLNGRGLLYTQDGALWFKSTQFGDDKDRVLKKSSGEYTYFASDIAYHKNKFLDRHFNSVIDILGADHHGYVKRMQAAVTALGIDKKQLHIILVQIVNLLRKQKKVSMSTRRAEYVTLNEVLNEVGVDATRFMFVSRSVNAHIDFDIEVIQKQSNENPVYYVQYAYARIMNIFKQINKKSLQLSDKINFSYLHKDEELKLAFEVIKFKDYIKKAHDELEPYYITKGLLDISEKLHQFYNKHRVIGSDNNLLNDRAKLLLITAKTMSLGFNLIGVEAKEKM